MAAVEQLRGRPACCRAPPPPGRYRGAAPGAAPPQCRENTHATWHKASQQFCLIGAGLQMTPCMLPAALMQLARFF
jgi:hypothetical protein